MKNWTVIIAFLGLITACQTKSAQPGSVVSSGLDKITEYLDLEAQMGFSGVVAIRMKDQPVFFKSIGLADREKGLANTPNTVFDIGSLTKQFTGAAILRLEEMGQLRVSDSLKQYFQDIPPDKGIITIHQLLIHTSGLPWRIGSDFEKLTREEFLERVFNLSLNFKPGEKYEHSHVGYSLLGIIIEQLSGTTYEKFLAEQFFHPLEMQQTGYVLPDWNDKDVAKGYRKCKNWGKPHELNWGAEGPSWNLKGNAGLLSTARDLMVWQSALSKGKVFSDSTYNRYISPYIQEGQQASSYYSYGWMIIKSLRGTPVYAHEGGNGRFYSDWLNYPEEDVSILVLTNNWSPGTWNVATQLASIVFYPQHEPEVQLKTVNCMTDYPDNVMGHIAENLINFLTSMDEVDPNVLAEQTFGDYVKNKYAPEDIINTLLAMQKDCGVAELRQLVWIGDDFLEVELNRLSDQQRVSVHLQFDQADRYRVRKITYNSD